MSRINNTENSSKYSSVTVAPEGGSVQKSKKKKQKSRNIYETRTLKSKKKTGFPIGAVLAIAVITVLLMMLVSDYVAINEYTREVSTLNSNLETLKREEKKLSAEYENKNDIIAIEKYAAGNLGMVQSGDVQKRYVEIGQDESVDVYEVEEDGTMSAITSALFALTDNLIESWNTLIGNE